MPSDSASAAGLLIAGTSSDAGKSIITAGLCRAFARRGVRVAPFKAQNMSNNSMVCAGGGEIGRAQYLQAQAAGVIPTTAMNPVLIKPGTDRRAFVVVRGQAAGTLEAGEYATERRQLADAAFEAYAELAGEYELVICEGAGSPAEINLRAHDFINMGLARRFNLPTIVIGDIDRGGILASLYGTWALLEAEDRALIQGFLINKFRGDERVLAPGLDMITERTGVPFLGTIPWLEQVWLDSEDTLQPARWTRLGIGKSMESLRIAVVRLPRISNATDLDALASEPGVELLFTVDPLVCEAADLLILPGSRSTVGDLQWLRERGIADVVARRAASGRSILGICGGYQMFALEITDDVESESGSVKGLGLLPTQVEFDTSKTLGRPTGQWEGIDVEGYTIHHGTPRYALKHTSALVQQESLPFLDGLTSGSVWGTMWHGIFENDEFRRAWLSQIARNAHSAWQPHADSPNFHDHRERMLNTLADAMEAHVDLEALTLLAKRAGN